MKTLTSIVLNVSLILLTISSAQAQNTNTFLEGIIGTYQSSIYSYDRLYRGVTKFQRESKNSLKGKYQWKDSSGIQKGSLSKCKQKRASVMRCTWTDAWGSGPLVMRFSSDFKNFEGTWAADGNLKTTYPWNGIRK